MNNEVHWALQKWCSRNEAIFCPEQGEYNIDTTIHISGKMKIGKGFEDFVSVRNGPTKLDIQITEIKSEEDKFRNALKRIANSQPRQSRKSTKREGLIPVDQVDALIRTAIVALGE